MDLQQCGEYVLLLTCSMYQALLPHTFKLSGMGCACPLLALQWQCAEQCCCSYAPAAYSTMAALESTFLLRSLKLRTLSM